MEKHPFKKESQMLRRHLLHFLRSLTLALQLLPCSVEKRSPRPSQRFISLDDVTSGSMSKFSKKVFSDDLG